MMFAQDPLYAGDWLGDALITGLKVLVAFAFLLVAVMLNIWFLRKVISDFQNRIGPNTAGRWGILQSLADGIKLFFKEDLIPDNSDRFAFKLAPYLSLVPAFLVFAIIPIGGDFNGDDGDGVVSIFGHDTLLQVADPPVGVLWFLAMSSLAIYGVMLAGWSSGSKYPLIGSVRASAQMVSYEAALGLALASVLLVSGTLSTHAMVIDQSGEGPAFFGIENILPAWYLLPVGIVPFVVFIIAVDTDRLTEASLGYYINPLVSVALGMIFLGERMRTLQWVAVIIAAIGVAVLAIKTGGVPWISLSLAGSFAFYGLIRKQE